MNTDANKNNNISYDHDQGFVSRSGMDLSSNNLESFEKCWSCYNEAGWGKFLHTEIRPGFEIWLTECLFHEKVVFSFSDEDPILAFTFILSGDSRSLLNAEDRKIQLTGGSQGIFYYPNPMGSGFFETHIPVRQLSIIIDPDKLLYYFEYDVQSIPFVLRSILINRNNQWIGRIDDISPAMYLTAHQLLSCPFHGVTRKLFLESRALELIALQLDHMSLTEDRPSGEEKAASMNPGDKKRTDYAKELLINDLENPPDLKALSRAAGMSHPKLNQCFQKAYGMTVFQYLKFERLNKAREMLTKSGLNVTETAYSVGYSSLSHFSKAYKKQFGISPGIHAKTD